MRIFPAVQTRKRNKRGFTLVEILVAVLLLSTALLAILTATKAGVDQQRSATYKSVARSIAQSKLEEMRAKPFSQLSQAVPTTSDSSLPSGNTISVETTSYPSMYEDNLYKVTVTVTWPDGGQPRKVQYETLVARK